MRSEIYETFQGEKSVSECINSNINLHINISGVNMHKLC